LIYEEVYMLNTFKKKYAPYWQLYVFLIIPIAYVIIFKYIPMAGIQLAFRKYSTLGGIWNSPWVGFANFKKFFNSYQFERIIVNTLRLSAYSIFAGFPVPIIFALMLNTVLHTRFKKAVQTITYMPHFISQVVLVGILMQLFNPTYGAFPSIIHALTGAAVGDIFASPIGTVHLYVWSGIWQGFGWGSIMYLAALTSVNPELHEAAEIDGASRFQRVVHIDFPSILPTITIMLILRMGSVMSIGFEKIFLMRNTLNLQMTEVISTYEYLRGIGSNTGGNDYSLSTTIGLFNSVINLILLATVNKLSSKLSDNSLW
jgi:putative aldouronate transport system permease protein